MILQVNHGYGKRREYILTYINSLPILTRYIFSFFMIKSKASSIFSILCACTRGFLLYLPTFFWDKTSSSIIRRMPSEKSWLNSLMQNSGPCFLRCSLHHRVNVFFWILFHSASIAASDKIKSSFTMGFSSLQINEKIESVTYYKVNIIIEKNSRLL